MPRTKRLTEFEKIEIVREAADGVPTSVLAEQFGVSVRAVQYTLKANDERRRDVAVATAAVTVKLTPEELAAFDEVLVSAGIENRAEGVRRLIQAAGGTFVPDVQLAVEMARYRSSLNDVGNGVVRIAKAMTEANRNGQGAEVAFSDLRLAQMRALARFILDTADEIDLLVRRRRDALQLEVTSALREFVHAAE